MTSWDRRAKFYEDLLETMSDEQRELPTITRDVADFWFWEQELGTHE